MSVSRDQRYTKDRPCPICDGYDGQQRGKGERCHGYVSDDGNWAYCSREEYAGGLPWNENARAFAHKLTGDCACGTRHDPRPDDPTPNSQAKRRIVATYNYLTDDGTLAYQVVRYEPKHFVQRRPVGRDWVWNVEGVTRVLYRLPELLRANPEVLVYLTEGEKDANALAALGLVATTNAGGAGKWLDEYAECLRGRDVVILPDNDEAGRKHAELVAGKLRGVAANVRILALPKLPEKGDVSDWLAAGGTAEQLTTLALATPIVDARFTPNSATGHRESSNASGFRLTTLADLLAEPDEEEEWLIEGLLPTGGTSLVVAKPKVGKSTLVRNLALAVTGGTTFLGRNAAPGAVIYLALEEKRQKVKAHFAALGGVGNGMRPLLIYVGAAPQDPLRGLRALIEEHQPALVIIDPLQRFLRLRDGNDYASVSTALEPLHDLARSSGCHLALVHHANKGGQGNDGVLGSTAFFAAVDTLLNLNREDGHRTIDSTQRYGADLEKTRLSFDPESGCVTLGVTAGEMRHRKVAESIVGAVGAGNHTQDEIRRAVGGDQSLTSKVLREMVETGELRKIGVGVRGHAAQYHLPETEPKNALAQIPDARWDSKEVNKHREMSDDDEQETRIWAA